MQGGYYMKRLSFNPRFVNEAGNDLIPGKIHTIRQNYDFWKRFEGQDVALYIWEGKPYRSKQKVFCVKRLVSVQKLYMYKNYIDDVLEFFVIASVGIGLEGVNVEKLRKNDGFCCRELFEDWFVKYHGGEMAILHFTDYRY
jgi:hypothetical protein